MTDGTTHRAVASARPTSPPPIPPRVPRVTSRTSLDRVHRALFRDLAALAQMEGAYVLVRVAPRDTQ